MDLAQFWWQSAAAPAGIGNALRFRGSSYLERAIASGGSLNQSVSSWVKLGDTTSKQVILARAIGSGTFRSIDLYDNAFQVRNGDTGVHAASPGLQRDCSAWYHIVATIEDGVGTKLYLNGELAGSSSSVHTFTSSGKPLGIGKFPGQTNAPLKSYLAEFHFVDGQVLDPTSFGQFNADGVWVPKKVSGVTYGTHGFHLDFSDPADIGADRSGNGNNFTATGFELTTTTSTNYDLVADSPTDNFATLNPLKQANLTTSNANLGYVSTTNGSLPATITSTSDFYIECDYGALANGFQIGLINTDQWPGQYGYFDAASARPNWIGFLDASSSAYYICPPNAAGVPNVSQPVSDASRVFMLAYKNSTRSYYLGINGTWYWYTSSWQSSATLAGAQPIMTMPADWAGANVTPLIGRVVGSTISPNYGQRPFAYTPPAGFKPLSTAELPAVAITKPSDHFSTVLDTGANILTAAQAKFSNGLWWIKDRANSNQHQLVDSVRGGNLALQCPANGQETAYAAPAGNSVAWCWNVGGAPVANTNGTIPSQVSANKAAGFSIVTYTGTQVSSTVGHGLDAAPEMIIAKRRNNSSPFDVYHTGLTSASYRVQLDSRNAESISNGSWNGTDPTDTVFSVKDDIATNRLNDQHVAYCWHSVPGYSAMGSYVGNGIPDGPFNYTGFRVGFLIWKCINEGNCHWYFFDSSRDSYNPCKHTLWASLTSQEDSTYERVDLLSNGFKMRGSDASAASVNKSGNKYIWCAFAEHPFGGSNVSPAPAR